VSEAPGALSLGSKPKLIPGHCDPTVNLYDWYVAVRGGRVEERWPIVGRSALLRQKTVVLDTRNGYRYAMLESSRNRVWE
jgi:hypothetical protein